MTNAAKPSLVSTPQNKSPSKHRVFYLEVSDQIFLRAAVWPRTAKVSKGTVCILQGRAETIEKYFETIGDLRRRGFHVVAFDWRGQGGSTRVLDNARKGHITDFRHYIDDLVAVCERVVLKNCPQPYFCLAHSMGAAVLFLALERHSLPFARAVALSPMVALSIVKHQTFARSAGLVLRLLGFGGSFVPGGGETPVVTRPFESNRLTSDPARYARNADLVFQAPHLALGDPTIGWVHAAFQAMRRLESPGFARRIHTPVLTICAGEDRVVSTPAAERFASRLKSGRLLTLPGARHELLMETDRLRDQLWAAFDAFIPGSPPSDVPRHGADPEAA